MVTMAKAFAQRGYVAVSINYRLLNNGEKCGVEDPVGELPDRGARRPARAQAAVRWCARTRAPTGSIPRGAMAVARPAPRPPWRSAVNSDDPGTAATPALPRRSAPRSRSPPRSLTRWPRRSSTRATRRSSCSTAPPTRWCPTPSRPRRPPTSPPPGIPTIFEPLVGGGHVPMKQFGDTIVTQSVYFAYDSLDSRTRRGSPPRRAAPSTRR